MHSHTSIGETSGFVEKIYNVDPRQEIILEIVIILHRQELG